MMSHRFLDFVKESAFPIWTRLEGTPFSLPGRINIEERLPGATSWVPRNRIEEIAQQLEEGQETEDISQQQAMRGLAPDLLLGAGAGLTGGVVGARLAEGREAYAPVKEMLRRGLRGGGAGELRNLRALAKFLPAAGAGAGLLGGLGVWGSGIPQRRHEAREVVRGLLAERLLQRNAVREAAQTSRPYTKSILSGLPPMSATAPSPSVVIPGNVGV